jgi:hypothetical protein
MPCNFCNSPDHSLSRCNNQLLDELCKTAYAKCYNEFVNFYENGIDNYGNWLKTLPDKDIFALSSRIKFPTKWKIEHKCDAIKQIYYFALYEIKNSNIPFNKVIELSNLAVCAKFEINTINYVKTIILEKIEKEKYVLIWKQKINRLNLREMLNFYHYLMDNYVVHDILPENSTSTDIRNYLCGLQTGEQESIFNEYYNFYVDESINKIFVNENVLPKKISMILCNDEKCNKDDDCAVCLELLNNDIIVKTNCSHHFCCNCLYKINKNATEQIPCPICREEIKDLQCFSQVSYNILFSNLLK